MGGGKFGVDELWNLCLVEIQVSLEPDSVLGAEDGTFPSLRSSQSGLTNTVTDTR